MPIHKKYKIDELIERVYKNENDVSRLNKQKNEFISEYYLKTKDTIKIVDKVEVQHGYPYKYYFSSTTSITDFPEWAIPYVNVTCDAESEDGYIITFDKINQGNQYLQLQLNYHWQPSTFNTSTTGEDLFTLYTNVYGRFMEKLIVSVGSTMIYKPFYINLYLTIMNERVMDGIQTKKN